MATKTKKILSTLIVVLFLAFAALPVLAGTIGIGGACTSGGNECQSLLTCQITSPATTGTCAGANGTPAPTGAKVTNGIIPDNLEFKPQVTLPDSQFTADQTFTFTTGTSPIALYIKGIYHYGVSIVGILAAIMLMIGGLIWLTSEGSSGKIENAKSMIFASLSGLFLVLASYILLNAVNPDLVKFKIKDIPAVRRYDKITCCKEGDDGDQVTAEYEADPSGAKLAHKGFKVGPFSDKSTISFKAGEILSCDGTAPNSKALLPGSKELKPNELCLSYNGKAYKIQPVGTPCGQSGGQCLDNSNNRPDGWAIDLNETCPDKQTCYYHDANVRLKNETCGRRGRCMFPADGNTHCPDGYEWDMGSGADCGASLYCCYSYAEAADYVTFVDPNTCKNNAGAACKVGNDNGYCNTDGQCYKCTSYSSACWNDYQCKDQSGDESQNADGPCGQQIDGDCNWRWVCDSNDH